MDCCGNLFKYVFEFVICGSGMLNYDITSYKLISQEPRVAHHWECVGFGV